MNNLPDSVLEYIYNLTVEDRSLAYFVVSHSGKLLDHGGDLKKYGICDLESNSELSESIIFMKDILPLKGEAVSMANVEIAKNVTVDIHIIPEKNADRVLLLDANINAEQLSLFQQTANNMRLVKEKNLKLLTDKKITDEDDRRAVQRIFSDMSVFSTLLRELNVVVLERESDNYFTILSGIPNWFLCCYPASITGSLKIEIKNKYLFLENFLIDANLFWSERKEGFLKSGQWTKTDISGNEYYLEATALNINSREILLIEQSSASLIDKAAIIQKAREKDLLYNSLDKEIQKKDILINCVVHDLSNPLTLIKGYLSMIADEDISDQSRDYLDISKQQIEKLDRMIHEVSDIFSSDIEAFKSSNLKPLNSHEVMHSISDVIESFLLPYSEKDVRLQFDPKILDESAWKVTAEKNRLQRIFINLLENAYRYSPKGSVVTVSVEDEGDDVTIFVEDEGTGVVPEIEEHIFKLYYKGGKKTGKLGLGLYFCRITVEAWGGSIGYLPRAEGGARFWFKLPKHL